MRRSGKLLGRRAFSDREDVNPMSYMSNLSDVMLVLAVGIMMALVIAWDVDIINTNPEEQTSSSMAQVEELQSEVLDMNVTDQKDEDSVSIEDYGLTEYGTVYIDDEGNLYVLTPEG